MVGGAVPIGPMDGESPHSSTSEAAEILPGGASTRWIVLAVLMTGAVLDLAGVLELPTDDLLQLLLYVL